MQTLLAVVLGGGLTIAAQRIDAAVQHRRERRIGEWVVYTELMRAHGGIADTLEQEDIRLLLPTSDLATAWREHRAAFAALPFAEAIAIYDAVATAERAHGFATTQDGLTVAATAALEEAEGLLVAAIDILRPRVTAKKHGHRQRSSP